MKIIQLLKEEEKDTSTWPKFETLGGEMNKEQG
jgi:hypothetical protein